MGSLACRLCIHHENSGSHPLSLSAATLSSPVDTDHCSDCINHCKYLKKIKYVEEHETICHNEHHEVCDYKTEYKEKCVTKREKACEKFWKEDGKGGKVWTEDPSKCYWLEADECHDEPVPIKVCEPVMKEVCEQIHKNTPYQFECEVCGHEEKECKKLETKYHFE